MESRLDRIAARIIAISFPRLTPSLARRVADLVERSAEETAYRRLVDSGFSPRTLIDVGAYHGEWSRLAQRVFGPLPTLMIEAQPGKQAILDRVSRELPMAHHAICFLGEKSGETVAFFEMETGSSFLPEASDVVRSERKLQTRTLDEVVDENLPTAQSAFLKIDVQGAELHVLRGGLSTLARTEVVQLEVALLNYNVGAPLLPESVAAMADYGFLPIEVSGFSRPRGHLVQIDLLFARNDSNLRPKFFEFGSKRPSG